VGSLLKICGITSVLLLALSPSGFSQTDTEHLIVPGQGIGPIKLGMSVDAVESILGTPVFHNLGSEFDVEYWRPSRYFTVVYYHGPDSALYGGVIAVGISVGVNFGKNLDPSTAESYATAEGVHIGSKVEEVRAAFGGPSNVERGKDYLQKDYDLLEYRGRGISVYVQQGLVFRIFVCRPYAEFCSALPPTLFGRKQMPRTAAFSHGDLVLGVPNRSKFRWA